MFAEPTVQMRDMLTPRELSILRAMAPKTFGRRTRASAARHEAAGEEIRETVRQVVKARGL